MFLNEALNVCHYILLCYHPKKIVLHYQLNTIVESFVFICLKQPEDFTLAVS